GRGADVAMAIEHGKRVVVLERQPRTRGTFGGRNVKRRLTLPCRRILKLVCAGFQEPPFRARLPPPWLRHWAAAESMLYALVGVRARPARLTWPVAHHGHCRWRRGRLRRCLPRAAREFRSGACRPRHSRAPCVQP